MIENTPLPFSEMIPVTELEQLGAHTCVPGGSRGGQGACQPVCGGR